MEVNLLNGKVFTNVVLVGQTSILCTIIPKAYMVDGGIPDQSVIEERGILIPWTSILYIT